MAGRRSSQDAAPEVREETAWALGRRHSLDAADILKKLCRDASEPVRITAMENLDYAFPEVARGVLKELAADSRFPDRSKAIELLGRYRFPEVRKLLAFLCGDVDSNVKQRAVESLTRIDASLSVELKHIRVTKRQTIPRKLLRGLGQLIGVEEFKRLILEERLRGALGTDAWFKAVGRIQADAELKLRFRIATSLVVGGFVCLVTVFPGAALAAALRGLLFSGGILWHGKWIVLSVFAIALSTFLPSVKRLFKVGKPRRALWTARVVGMLAVLLCIGALVVAYWWIGGIVLLLGSAGFWWAYRRVRRVLRNFFVPAPSASAQEQAQGAEPKAPAAQ